MITALVSTILGIVGGAIPKLIGIFERKQAHTQEVELRKLDMEMTTLRTKLAIQEIDAEAFVEEMKAFRDQLKSIYSSEVALSKGHPFISGFNALIRPTTAAVVMLLFVGTSIAYSWGVIEMATNGVIGYTDVATLIWGSLVGEAIQAVLGYLFGYRTTKKMLG